VIPVAGNVWQPISAVMPAAAARRRIMHQASDWVHGELGQPIGFVPTCGAEQPALAIVGDAGRVDEGAQRFGERVMARHRRACAGNGGA
jgi:hypothetical protein